MNGFICNKYWTIHVSHINEPGDCFFLSKVDPKIYPGFRPPKPDSLQQPNDTSYLWPGQWDNYKRPWYHGTFPFKILAVLFRMFKNGTSLPRAKMMLYLIGPDGLVNWRFVNFLKMIWIISQNFHTLILNLGMHIIHIHAVFWKFAYLRFTPYADNIRFSHKQNLKLPLKPKHAKSIFFSCQKYTLNQVHMAMSYVALNKAMQN